jgi:dTDP-4-amino-4,6-dideoxygalactose transaminase
MVGNFGDAEVFSFHATKFFNTFEGGAIATNNDDLADRIRLMKNFGFAGRDSVIYIGTNGKMSEASAAMGLTGLECLDRFVEANYRNYLAYQNVLADLPGLGMISYDEREKQNYQYIVVEVDDTVSGLNRDQLVTLLNAENVLARRYFYPGCHKMEPYRSYFPHAGLLLPETERLTQRVMSLPTGTAVELEDIHTIGQIIRFSLEHSEKIRVRLRAR